MLDFQKDRLRHLVANAILELWKKETGSTTAVYIEGTLCITARNGKTTIVQVADQFPGSIPEEGDSEMEEKGINGITPLPDSSPVKKDCNGDSIRDNPSNGRHFISPSKARNFSHERSPENRLPSDYSRRFSADGFPVRGGNFADGVSPKGRRHLLEVNTGNTGRSHHSPSNGKHASDGSLNFAARKLSSAKKKLDSREGLKLPKPPSTFHDHLSEKQLCGASHLGFGRPLQQTLDNNNNYRNTESDSSCDNPRSDKSSECSKMSNILGNANRFTRESDILGNVGNDDSEDSYDDEDDDDSNSIRAQNDSGIADTNNSTLNSSNLDSSLIKDSYKRTPAKRHLESRAENHLDVVARPLSSVDSSQRKIDCHLASPNRYAEQMRDSIKRRLLSTMNNSLIPLGLSPFGFPFPTSATSTSSPFPSPADIFQNSLPSYAHLASTPAMNGWPMPMGLPHSNHSTSQGLLHMATPFSPPHFSQNGRGEQGSMMQSPPMRQSILSPPNSLHQILSSGSRVGMSSARRRHISTAHKSEKVGSVEDFREGKEVDSNGSPENGLETPGGEQRVYRCDQCFKTFLFKSKYLEHLPVHTSARPFQCHLCSRTYKYKYDLRVHLRAHLGIPTKSTVCPFCAEKFGTNKQLRQHIHEAHKEQQAIGEDQCAKSLQQIAALNAVRSIPHGINLVGQISDEILTPNFLSATAYNEFKSDDANVEEVDSYFENGSIGNQVPEDERGSDSKRNLTGFGDDKIDVVEATDDDRVRSQQSTSESLVSERLVIDESVTTAAV